MQDRDQTGTSERKKKLSRKPSIYDNNDDKKCLNTDRNNFHIFCDDCVIKSCIVERGFDNCTQCAEYPCKRIE